MRLYRRWTSLLGVGLVLVLSGGNVSSSWAQRPDGANPGARGVVLAQGTLSVDVQDEEFDTMLRDIASRAQIEISNLDRLPNRRISTQFTELSLVEGLKRLLRVAGVPGYALITAHTEDGVRVERILFLDADASTGARSRATAAPQIAGRRARRVAARSQRERSRTAAPDRQERDRPPTSVFEDLKANPQTERLLNQVVHPNEQVREQAIEGLMRLASDTNKQRDLMEALEPYLDDLRRGDKEAREEARQDIRSMLRR